MQTQSSSAGRTRVTPDASDSLGKYVRFSPLCQRLRQRPNLPPPSDLEQLHNHNQNEGHTGGIAGDFSAMLKNKHRNLGCYRWCEPQTDPDQAQLRRVWRHSADFMTTFD